MAFKDIVFPDSISYGATSSAEFSTDVVVVASGHEQRNQNWEEPRYKFEAAHSLKTQEQLDELIEFFHIVGGRAHSFRFKNWAEYTIDETKSAVKEVGSSQFQLYKKYQIGSLPAKYKKITKPVEGTLTVYRNGIIAGGWTCDYKTGIITITATEEEITFSCEFDFEVRFNSDRMYAKIVNYNNFAWEQIELVEIK